MYIDSHCHLNFPEFQSNLDEILIAMGQAQVDGALCVCTTLDEFTAVHQLALSHAKFWASVGVHPDYENTTEPSIEDLVRLGASEKVVAIGETGLDYYRLNGQSVADLEWQRARFRTHIRAAQTLRLPLIIHTRCASDDTIAILKAEGEDGKGCVTSAGGVFHCFTESIEVARAALDMGFYISLSGIVTFKNALEIKEVAKFTPLDRLLIETDSPYLAPVPYRGKTNNPSYVPLVAACIAELKNSSVEEIAQATSQNFYQLFSKANES